MNTIHNICECCQCDPCDCYDWGEDEFWGMDTKRDHQIGENNYMASSSSGSSSESNSQVEDARKQSKNRILSKDLYSASRGTGEAHKWDTGGSSRSNGD